MRTYLKTQNASSAAADRFPAGGMPLSGMGTQATDAHLHGIECVERLGLNPLMRALVWLLEWLPAKTAEWLN